MKNKIIASILIMILALGTLSGCGNSSQENMKEANACYETGLTYLYGLEGQEINLEAAYTNFEQALEKGKIEANFYLGVLCDWYSYPEKNYEKAKAYYEAAGDNPYAQLSLGLLYLDGLGVKADTAKAQELFNTVIANGCVEGYFGSASIAYTEKDYATALEYYNKAIEGQEQLYISIAMNQIGLMYHVGHGVEQDYDKALEWYKKAADLGNTNAMCNIGFMYGEGLGVEQDYDKVMEWYEKAADLGYPSAMYSIGFMYQYELGVEQDYDKAMMWYEKAADLGDAKAMYNIGYMYENGLGVKQDSAKSKEWFDKANKTEMAK